jgi:SAM-dependent methyltransferase
MGEAGEGVQEHGTASADFASSSLPHCRICGSGPLRKAGEVEFFVGYRWPVFDCAACGCRFTHHDPAAYETMYAQPGSCYNRYVVSADKCKALFDRGDRAGLKAELSYSSRYLFIIDAVEAAPRDAHLLEIGCSRGHLTSYFVLQGRNVTGVDVSATAVAAANAAFGDHFVTAGDARIAAGAPYDIVYHVGTIGCVADPLAMTRALLALLKPGGRLLFNAPNRDALVFDDQVWVESAPPPDLVTLFPPGFWRRQMSGLAQVRETFEHVGPVQSLELALQRVTQRHWHPPSPTPLDESMRPRHAPQGAAGRLFARVQRRALRLAAAAGLAGFLKPRPTEYGYFVELTKS